MNVQSEHKEDRRLVRMALLPAVSDVSGATLAKTDTAIAFLRGFTLELYREISWRVKFLTAFAFLGITGGLLYAGHAVTSQRRAREERASSQISALNQRNDQQDVRLQDLQNTVARSDNRIANLLLNHDPGQGKLPPGDRMALATRVWADYHRGVCLIAGSYILLDPGTGLPLRYPENQPSEQEQLLTTGTQEQLTPLGTGSIFSLEFVGTGFHVGDGYVVTNRHVIDRPWAVDHRAELMMAVTGATPRVDRLLAYFPGRRTPISLRHLRSADDVDLAVSRFERPELGKSIPALPLASDQEPLRVGEPVVSMGYPTGPGRLVALLPPDEASALNEEYGGSLLPLMDQLAPRELIKPLTSQGQVTDLYRDRVVYDARTTEGASGSPIFGRTAAVVAIAFAEYIGETGSNFAVPVEKALPVLRAAGWHSPFPALVRKI